MLLSETVTFLSILIFFGGRKNLWGLYCTWGSDDTWIWKSWFRFNFFKHSQEHFHHCKTYIKQMPTKVSGNIILEFISAFNFFSVLLILYYRVRFSDFLTGELATLVLFTVFCDVGVWQPYLWVYFVLRPWSNHRLT